MREQLLGKPRGEILPVHVPVIIPCPFRGLKDQRGPWDPSCDRHGMDNNQTWPLARGFVDPRPIFLNTAPCGWTLSTSTLSSGASPLRGGGIRAAFDPLSLFIDHPIRWVPDAPHPHLTPTVRTDQRVPSRTLLVPLPIGSSSDDLHRALDHALHLG